MISFKKFLAENVNIHTKHLEELSFKGVDSLRTAINVCRDIRDNLSGYGKSKKYNITLKIDGAPALLCGLNPENGKFFVSTKALFNKVPKLAYTDADVDEQFGSGGLAEKLKTALDCLPKIGIKGILQGDFLYTRPDLKRQKIDGKSNIIFRPNTITYAVESDSDLGQIISNSKMGIVFHTSYSGNSITNLKSSFNVDISGLKKTKDVWFIDAYFKDFTGVINFTQAENDEVTSLLSEIGSIFNSIDSDVLNGLAEYELPMLFEIFVNGNVRAGEDLNKVITSIRDFETFLKSYYDKKMDGLKTDKGKEKIKQDYKVVADYVKDNKSELVGLLKIYHLLYIIKLKFVNKFNEIRGQMGTFIETANGFEVTTPEGYCAVEGDNIIKFVDRMEFSKNNFNLAKQWS